MNSCQRTTEEQREFISELIKLSLFFSSEYQKRHREEDISSVIIKKTSMWEIIGLKGSGEESAFTRELAELYGKTASSGDFEKTGLEHLLPHIDIFSVTNLEWGKKVLAKYDDSCLRYDSPSGAFSPNYCNFHITNYISPKSILREEKYTAGCFIRLMDETEKKFNFDTLRTSTWLNSVPQWLKFFPEEWTRNMGEPLMEISGNLGSWGQILTARKTFNFKTGDYIRANLEMPFKPRASWCSFTSMREYVKKFFKGKIL